jgi:tetratricopeptide (TPR) repeat protein
MAVPESLSLAGPGGISSTTKPNTDPVREKEQKKWKTRDHIVQMLKEGQYREATKEWDRLIAEDPNINYSGINYPESFAWELAKAYLRLGQNEKAIAVYKPHYHVATESVEQRAELGEILLFGSVGARPTKLDYPIGKGQCHLCHKIFKETIKEDLEHDPFQPYLFNFAPRIKELIKSPKYQKRSKDTVQPEAFPGSGIATSLIEYLAESNVCPSCYIATRVGFKDDDRDSIMPAAHKPPISLTIDEMVAIDTWFLKREGEEIPSIGVMRSAYEKFLPENDRPISYAGIQLASLYDMKGDLELAVKLLDANYPNMLRYAPGKLTQWRNDHQMFPHLKQRPEIVSRFPNLLQTDSRPTN